MEIQVLWWQWILEIFLPSFIALWFGLGALVVGLVAWFFPHMGVSWEVCIWVFASSSFVLLWFKVFKPSMVDKTKAGISRDAALGEAGQGEDEWDFICVEEVAEGDKVFIKDFSGNTLIVSKLGT